MFAPYRPSDYRGLIDEFLVAQEKKNQLKVNGNGRAKRRIVIFSATPFL
jgi:hypothetical protein